MGVLAAIILWFLLGLLAVLMALLITPVRLHATLHTTPHLSYRVDARVFGGLSPELLLVDGGRARTTPETKRKPKKKVRHAHPGSRFRGQNFGAAGLRLASGLLRAIHLEHLRCDLSFGLSDPADTGQIYGCLAPLQFGGTLPREVMLSVQPDFGRPHFDCDIDAAVSITAAALVPHVARFAWQVYGPSR